MKTSAAQLAGAPVLVTGASGFLGTHLCLRLEESGVEIHAVSREPQSSAGRTLRWHALDLRDGDGVKSLVSQVQPKLIYHLASQVAGNRNEQLVSSMLEHNLLSTVHVLSAAAQSGARVVLAGSMGEPRASEEATPCSPYAAAKWAASGYARMYHQLYSVDAVILRIFMVYGPGPQDTRKLVPYVIQALLRGEAPQLSSGRRRVDWVYVEDVVDALIASGTRSNLAGQTIDVGSGSTHTVREVVECLARQVEPSSQLIFSPSLDRPGEAEPRANLARTKALLDWTPATPLDRGLATTVAWFRENTTSKVNCS
jgi:nucleoside-diphosphate-sugar epimerase